MNLTAYTIKRIESIDDIDQQLREFFMTEIKTIARLYGGHFSECSFDFLYYARTNLFWVCFKDDKPVGVMLAQFTSAALDSSKKILAQDLLYSKHPGDRTAYLLMKHFIDFGKLHANDIITMVNAKTNIKPRSLEKLGFKKAEVVYRLEV